MDEELQVAACDCLRHYLATIAYRGGKVLRAAPPGFGSFTVGDATRTPGQVLAHICDLFDWALSIVRGSEIWRDSTPGPWDSDVQRFFQSLAALDQLLAKPGPLSCPWTQLAQGPLADALTHIGQIAMLRGLAGSPVRGENYFVADISLGRIGPDQAPPRREAD